MVRPTNPSLMWSLTEMLFKPEDLKTLPFCFLVEGKQLENGAFCKQWHHDNYVISLHWSSFLQTQIQNDWAMIVTLSNSFDIVWTRRTFHSPTQCYARSKQILVTFLLSFEAVGQRMHNAIQCIELTTIQYISVGKTNHAIHWIMIHPVDDVNHLWTNDPDGFFWPPEQNIRFRTENKFICVVWKMTPNKFLCCVTLFSSWNVVWLGIYREETDR